MSVYLVFLVNIQFNIASLKKVFNSSICQRYLLLRTFPAGMWTRKGLFSGKRDLLDSNEQTLWASALFEVMGLQENSFLLCTCAAGLSTSACLLCIQQLSLASCLLCGILAQEGKWDLWLLKWTALLALTGPGFEPQLSELVWWSAGSHRAGGGWLACRCGKEGGKRYRITGWTTRERSWFSKMEKIGVW